MGDVVHVNFGQAPTDDDCRIVSMVWNLERSALLVWVINPADRDADEDVGTFYSHANATEAAAARADADGLLLVDHTAIDARGVWNHRPVATAVHVHASGPRFFVAIKPDCCSWSIHAGSYDDIEVAGDRAVELCRSLSLPIVDHVLRTR